jgi:hypothetical protein
MPAGGIVRAATLPILPRLARFFLKNGRYFLYAAIALGILVVVVVLIDRLSVKAG